MTNQPQVPATLEDIIFSDRNKAYGAYALRFSAENTTRKAFFWGTAIFVASLLTTAIVAKDSEKKELVGVEIKLEDIKIETPPVEQPKPETPPPVKEPVKVIKFVPYEIVAEPENEEVPPTQDELNNTDAQIGSKTVDGIVAPPEVIEEPTAKKEEVVEVEKPDEPLVFVEIQPEFPGGLKAFQQFLMKNLKYPRAAANAGIGGKVFLQFVVGKEGEISKVEVLKSIGFGCDQEAERVVKLMPHWIPGKQSGRAVPVKYTLPISFVLEQ